MHLLKILLAWFCRWRARCAMRDAGAAMDRGRAWLRRAINLTNGDFYGSKKEG